MKLPRFLSDSIQYLNNSAFLAGLAMIILNIGSKYIEIGLSKSQEDAIKNSIAREILIFTIVFVGTKDIILSILMTAAFIILSDHIFNEKSRFCVCPNYLRRLRMEADINGDNIISEDEEEKAVEIIRKAKQQRKKKQQAQFASYLPHNNVGTVV